MRLWHQSLIEELPRAQLLGQHRECCALRGNGWGRKHSTVDYVFIHSPYLLFSYHSLIMKEMSRRGYNVADKWLDKNYRGLSCEPYDNLKEESIYNPIYEEHNEDYLKEYLDNLENKGIHIKLTKN